MSYSLKMYRESDLLAHIVFAPRRPEATDAAMLDGTPTVEGVHEFLVLWADVVANRLHLWHPVLGGIEKFDASNWWHCVAGATRVGVVLGATHYQTEDPTGSLIEPSPADAVH